MNECEQLARRAILAVRRLLSRDHRPKRGCKLLAELDAPLVERVDVQDHTLDKDAMLVERHDAAQRLGIELGVDQRGRGTVAREHPVPRLPLELIADRPGHALLQAYEEPPLEPNQVRVRSLFSAVKHGTELRGFRADTSDASDRWCMTGG